MLRSAFLAVCALALAPPAAASASTISLFKDVDSDVGDKAADGVYRAAPGEANRLTVTSAGATLTVIDPGAVITPGAYCQADGAHRVACTAPPGFPLGKLGAELGDEDDTADGASYADGGTGNDTLHVTGSETGFSTDGGPGDDVVVGGGDLHGGDGDDAVTSTWGPDAMVYGDAGNDHVTGAQAFGDAGDDVVHGTPHDDVLDGGPGSDVVVGGAGEDTADYFDSPTGVTVDLEHPEDAGGPGEHDRLESIEDVRGSPQADVLRGDDGPNVLDYGWQAGGDTLVGRGGADTIWASGGPDLPAATVDAGAGNDRVHDQLGLDRVRCGTGVDTVDVPRVVRAADSGVVSAGCQRVTALYAVDLPYRVLLPRVRGHTVRSAARDVFGGGCGGLVTLRGPDRGSGVGPLLGQAQWRWRRHGRGHVGDAVRLRFRLTRAGRRAARRHDVVVERALSGGSCANLARHRGHVSTWLARL